MDGVSAAPIIDAATMKALMAGGVALTQVNASANSAVNQNTDALTVLMQANVIDAARGVVDAWA